MISVLRIRVRYIDHIYLPSGFLELPRNHQNPKHQAGICFLINNLPLIICILSTTVPSNLGILLQVVITDTPPKKKPLSNLFISNMKLAPLSYFSSSPIHLSSHREGQREHRSYRYHHVARRYHPTIINYGVTCGNILSNK